MMNSQPAGGGRPLCLGLVGATGLVGREFLDLLARRDFPISELRLMGSARSAGQRREFRGRETTVSDLAECDPSGIDLAFFAAGGEVAREHAPRFAAAGAVVIDNSSAFREDPHLPLVVPEINAAALTDNPARIIANPNCSTIIMLLPLAPLHRAWGIREVIVSTYQSVSGAGLAARGDLFGQARAFCSGEPEEWHFYDRPIFLNLLPEIGARGEDGDCLEERKMVRETRRILGDDSFPIYATCVRVPVERCHSEAVLVRLGREVTTAAVTGLLAAAPGVALHDLPTPRELMRREEVFVGRIRVAADDRRTVRFWVVSDQLWKGAALNAIQIAEHLLATGRFTS